MNIFLKISILLSLCIIPFTLNSTDIFHSSEGLVKIQANLNAHIIPGDSKLGDTTILLSASMKQENIHIVTQCEHKEAILYKKPIENNQMMYVIQLSFPTFCEMNLIRIGDKENIFTDTIFPLPIESHTKMEDIFINTKSSELLDIMRTKTPILSKKGGDTLVEKLHYLQTLYKNLYITLESTTAKNVLSDRDTEKYMSPVLGYTIPTQGNLIPGAGRLYRKDTTDGIHHGWDIMAPFGTPVRSLSKGKIIRIVDNWSWNTFNAIKRGNLTTDDELRNLDIFRGNQIWLQTMDGNVTFYSHLSHISSDIIVGSTVDAGVYIGNIGKSGVPDKNYQNMHLHFEIQQNPFLEEIKNPTYQDIMRWNYIGKGMKKGEIYEKMREIFQ